MRHIIKYFILTTLLFSIINSHAEAQNTPNLLGTFLIPYMVENEDSGAFIDLVEEIGRRIKKSFKIIIMSPQETFKHFSEKEIIGFFPGTETRIINFKSYEKSDPFYIKRDLIFSRKESVLKGLESLEGKKVGLTMGYTYSKNITSNTKINFEYPYSDIIGLRMLEKGRIDAFVVEEISGLKALQSCNCKNITYDPDFSVSSQKVYFVFQSTNIGKSLAKEFSFTINEMIQDGSLQKIFNVSEQWIKSLSEN